MRLKLDRPMDGAIQIFYNGEVATAFIADDDGTMPFTRVADALHTMLHSIEIEDAGGLDEWSRKNEAMIVEMRKHIADGMEWGEARDAAVAALGYDVWEMYR